MTKDENENEKKDDDDQDILHKPHLWPYGISSEPLIFAFIFSLAVFESAQLPSFYAKVCLEGKTGDGSCFETEQGVGKDLELENVSQRKTATLFELGQIINYVPFVLSTMLCGSYSDEYGKKIPMMVACAAMSLLVFAFNLLVSSPSIPASALIAWFLAKGVCSPIPNFITFCYSALNDRVSDKEQLLVRNSYLSASFFLGFVAGGFCGGYLLKATNAQFTLAISQLSFALTMLLVMIVYQDSNDKEEFGRKNRRNVVSEAIHHIKKAAKTFSKSRPNHGRIHLALTCLCGMIYASEEAGSRDIVSLYTFREPLSWSQHKLAWYYSANALIRMVGALVGAGVLKGLGFRDPSVFAVSLTSAAGGMFVLSLARSSSIMYASLLVGCLATAGFPAIRAHVVRLGSDDEAGELLSALTIVTGGFHLFSALVYNNLYNLSLSFWPGFTFAFAGCLLLICVCIALAMSWDMTRLEGRSANEQEKPHMKR